MKLQSMVVLAALAAASTAFAADMGAADSDGDGMISVDEFTVAYPDADSALFVAVDANADGMIDADEFETASGEGGLLAG